MIFGMYDIWYSQKTKKIAVFKCINKILEKIYKNCLCFLFLHYKLETFYVGKKKYISL